MREFRKERRFGSGGRGENRGGSFRDRGGFRGGPGRDFSRGGEMHQATCAECGKMCEVPFRPNGKKPVFCKDCFKNNKPEAAFRPSFQSDRPPQHTNSDGKRMSDLQDQIEILGRKIDTLTELVRALSEPSFTEEFLEEVEAPQEKPATKKRKKTSKK